jgi:hypothetical protein
MGRGRPAGASATTRGTAYSPRGSPYFAYDANRFNAGTPVAGGAILNFRDRALYPDDEPTSFLRLNLAGKTIVRQDFGPDVPPRMQGVGGMWWGGPSQKRLGHLDHPAARRHVRGVVHVRRGGARPRGS